MKTMVRRWAHLGSNFGFITYLREYQHLPAGLKSSFFSCKLRDRSITIHHSLLLGTEWDHRAHSEEAHSAQEMFSLFTKQGISSYEIWKYNSKRKQQGCFMFLGIRKISLALICLSSHFLKIQSKKYIRWHSLCFLSVLITDIWLLSRRRKCEAVISNCQCNVNLLLRVMLIE